MTFDPTQPLTIANFKDLPPLCADGAWGTELQKQGVSVGELCDLWNESHPDRVEAVARAYVDAGAQVIISNTFSSNRILLAKHDLADRATDLARAGAAISKRAAEGRAFVFASIGPCGKLPTMGEVDAADIEAAAEEQATAMAEGGADAIVIETQSDIMEAEAALDGARRGCDLPVGVSFTFDSGKAHDRTMMGVSIPQACEMAVAHGASFVGANCGVGIETFADIAQAYRDADASIPIWIKGNAGLPVLEKGETVFKSPPSAFAEMVEPLLNAGATFIGGCCGSSPDHIRAIREKLDHVRPA